jgi:hypothetical protein
MGRVGLVGFQAGQVVEFDDQADVVGRGEGTTLGPTSRERMVGMALVRLASF